MNTPTSSQVPVCYTRLIGQITEQSVSEVLKDIDGANNNEAKKVIIFTVCSAGGLLYYAQALYDAIKASKKPVVCIVSGTCMSAALMILQAAHKRISMPGTIFMAHQSSHWKEEHVYIDEMNIINQEWNRMSSQFVQQSIERSRVTKEEFEKLAKPRYYFSAEKAKELGFIDEVSSSWIEHY